jgi:hypothetical protein
MTKDPRLPLSLGVKIRRPRPVTDVVPNIARNPPALAVIDHFAGADTALYQLTGRPLRGLAVVVGNGEDDAGSQAGDASISFVPSIPLQGLVRRSWASHTRLRKLFSQKVKPFDDLRIR